MDLNGSLTIGRSADFENSYDYRIRRVYGDKNSMFVRSAVCCPKYCIPIVRGTQIILNYYKLEL